MSWWRNKAVPTSTSKTQQTIVQRSAEWIVGRGCSVAGWFDHPTQNPPSEELNIPCIDPRNISDEFKGMPTEQIKQTLDSRRRPFAVLAVNILHDLNMASIVRNHNAFLGSHFYYMGKKKYYRPGAVGAQHYEPVTFVENLEKAKETIPEDYVWVGIDNVEGSIPINEFDWPKKPLLVFGSEKEGLDFDPKLRYTCKHLVNIPQLGSVRSLNVATAAGIALYDLCLQQGWLHEQTRTIR